MKNLCKKHYGEVLPDEDENCSLCGSPLNDMGECTYKTKELDPIITVGQLKEALAELDDNDLLTVEVNDENGDLVDLFNFHIDVIDGIELTYGDVVREVRFCTRPHDQ
jgi:hypothetical protein